MIRTVHNVIGLFNEAPCTAGKAFVSLIRENFFSAVKKSPSPISFSRTLSESRADFGNIEKMPSRISSDGYRA